MTKNKNQDQGENSNKDKDKEEAVNSYGNLMGELATATEYVTKVSKQLAVQQYHYAQELESARLNYCKTVMSPVFDLIENLNHAVDSLKLLQGDQVLQHARGIELSIKALLQSLLSQGIRVIQPSIGDDFNPKCHEAISVEKSEKSPEDTIVKTLSLGYETTSLSKNYVFRAAKVIISKQ